MLVQLDAWTEAYEEEEARRKEEEARAAADDGWTVVERRGVRPHPPPLGHGGNLEWGGNMKNMRKPEVRVERAG